MKQSKPEIRLGARGWQFNDWAGEFYPDDLPQDWRFSYYSNEFKSVLVPYEYIHQYPLENWQEWLDDTEKDFSFYVELSELAKWPAVKPYLQLLGAQLKGVVIVVDALEDVEALAGLINKVKHLAPVNLKRTGANVTDKEMTTLQACYAVNECWDGDTDAPEWSYGGAAILLREEEEENSPEKLRQMVEKGLESAGNCEAIALFFAGPSPKISDMNNARMITELLI